MNRDPASILEEALKLPTEARAAIAASLIFSLEEPVDPDAEAAWAVEIERRIHELDSGVVRPMSWPEARRVIAGD
jgi:hypothetical protein